jgi:hypothetical protein
LWGLTKVLSAVSVPRELVRDLLSSVDGGNCLLCLTAVGFEGDGAVPLVLTKILLIANKLVFIKQAYRTTNVFLASGVPVVVKKPLRDDIYLTSKELWKLKKIAITRVAWLLAVVVEKYS